jgi:4-hydroxy-2-oxoheptanedioate aldolase
MEIRHPIDSCLPALLRSGRPVRGIFNGIPSPALVEMCAYAGFDFVIIDNEHGSADLQETEHMLRAARASGIAPVVRCFTEDVARTLDMGASGVQVPMVETAAQAAELVQRVRYPRAGGRGGRRGAAFSTRAAGYGAFGGPQHIAISDDAVAVIAMVETSLGVANAGAIAAVPGIDAVFVGPNDLAHEMGYENRWNEPAVQKAIERALRAVAAAGICPGILALTPAEEDRYAGWGARYFANATTGVITKALKEAAAGGRG